MSSLKNLPSLIDFKELQSNLNGERAFLVKENGEDYVRSEEDALAVLQMVQEIQSNLQSFFAEFPSLVGLFDKTYLSLNEFFKRDYILDICFLDDCLIPDKEMFYFGQDGGLSKSVLSLHVKAFKEWIQVTRQNHEDTQAHIKEHFSLDTKAKDLGCQCLMCIADFRAKLREKSYEDCLNHIEENVRKLEENLDQGMDFVSDIFTRLQKGLDKRYHSLRHRLKRSSLNRLEAQVKGVMSERLYYPSELGKKQVSYLRTYFKGLLYDEGLPEDLVTEEEFDRFFSQLSSNIWRNEKYHRKEFRKFMKSIVVLKKKDVSSKILQDYLGEFWVHSAARTLKRKIVYHMGPTNSGKTYHAIEALCQAEKGCYLAPLRLLAGELYDTMNSKGVLTTLLTGEEVVEVEGATHYSSTIEMARLQQEFDCCVIDEIQMITDPQRGWAWTRALVNIFSPEIHVCGDASVLSLIEKIVELCGDELEIKEYQRMTRLEVEKKPITLGALDKHDALIVFSRRNALRYKMDLERLGFGVSIVYGRLSPEVRREQARKFDQGETDIIVSTDAISMGMNLPIQRIVFSTLSKYIDSQEHQISDSEIKQIAGRAGRYKRYPTGFVTCLSKVEDGIENIQAAIDVELDQKTKCMVGPDLDIFSQVNNALASNGLPDLKLSDFLRLFNTMIFKKPFFCVELKEMIELAELVEDADRDGILSTAEIFGFACAPVNQGLIDHVQYYIWILNHYVRERPILFEDIDHQSDDIDYLETSIKCIELYQWLARHFNNKNFDFDEEKLLENKGKAIDQLNGLLSEKIVRRCSSCGVKLEENSKFAICEPCFKQRRFSRGGRRPPNKSQDKRDGARTKKKGGYRGKKTRSRKRRSTERS